MNKIISNIVVCFGLIFCFFVQAQAQESTTIIDYLQTDSSGSEGIILIESDSNITALIGKPNSSASVNENSGLLETTGYRLQIYMGNNPQNSRTEASARQSEIKKKYPEVSTYLNYDAPNWKLLAGDFTTREEASVFRQQLQKDFPQFGREIYIIVDKVKIPF
ncbi:MAG: SPOR domain-containing protein [Dysgonamonadaceae bacterium]|jgi:hypothetical protein|nr:SPOR domain-containing protein [Dysgonamonadaceae bacterium]